ncbi:hypothetical protein EF847_05405 [Actinobacteria bacterium YIM 96077]|uniref:Uncharacterized protein n=1 Tax=Phytoactinopolyspora halophila TaxID=1981511 RepID=A0A329R1U5_9ACTN|nr:hypothetical protein EF847_05405 [Actinobacteria bacterium YIM 96077]RAW18540.1 hypothetical protein DPM12_00110 [Phytoactinopolyspora halophila]
MLPDLLIQREEKAVVFEFVDEELQPVVGVPRPDAEERGPLSSDGSLARDADLGYVHDIAVDSEDRLLILERIDPPGSAAGFQVRRVEHDGTLVTVAGTHSPHPGGPFSDEAAERAAYPPDGSDASSLVIHEATAIAGGADESVYLQTTRSVLAIEDGMVRRILGGGNQMPPAPDGGPFEEGTDASSVAYHVGLPGSLSVNAEGEVLTRMDPVPQHDEDAYAWQLTGGGGRAQSIADASAQESSTTTIYTSADGEAMIASLVGGGATWLDETTFAIRTSHKDEGAIIVLADVHT